MYYCRNVLTYMLRQKLSRTIFIGNKCGLGNTWMGQILNSMMIKADCIVYVVREYTGIEIQ